MPTTVSQVLISPTCQTLVAGSRRRTRARQAGSKMLPLMAPTAAVRWRHDPKVTGMALLITVGVNVGRDSSGRHNAGSLERVFSHPIKAISTAE